MDGVCGLVGLAQYLQGNRPLWGEGKKPTLMKRSFRKIKRKRKKEKGPENAEANPPRE